MDVLRSVQEDTTGAEEEENEKGLECEEDTTGAEEEESEKGLECEEEKISYHHEYRKELLDQAAKAVGANYGNIHSNHHHAPLNLRHTDHEPSCGSTSLDVTAVHEDQLSWGKEIKHRPIELFSFYPSSAENVPKNAIGHLKYDGKLLSDLRGQPVRDFPSLPLVISSKVEGWRVESWTRSDCRMSMMDIIARMPVECETDPAGHQILMPTYDLRTVRERARVFRNKAGLISWSSKVKDPKIEKFMDELRSPAERETNQVLGRDLSDLEKVSLASLNVGTRPDRARNGQDPEATRRYLNSVQRKPDLTFDFDCRAERPETPDEIQQIQDALQQTHRDFAFYTNIPLEVPNSQDTYSDQWNSMQVQLNRIWANDKTKKTEPPQLFALGKWTGSFDNWVSAPQAYLTYAWK